MPALPKKLPMTYGDRALYGSGRGYCQIVHGDLLFGGRLDAERLVRAAGALCHHYPVLAARGDPARDRDWRIDRDFAENPRIRIEEIDGGAGGESDDAAIDRWLNTNIDVRSEAPLRLVLVRGEKTDRLLLSIHHSVGDGRSFLIALEALHRYYSDAPPAPPAPDTTPRDLPSLLSRYPDGWLGTYARALPTGLSRELRRPKSGGWVPQKNERPASRRRYTRIEFTKEETRKIHQSAKKAGRTFNDVMLAANGLAWLAMREAYGLPAVNYTIGMLVDMRRGEAARMQTIANLSSVEILAIPKEQVASPRFATAVMDAARERKARLPGVTAISPLLAIQTLVPKRWLVPRLRDFWDRGVKSGGLSSWLTNVGPLPEIGNWNGTTLGRAHILVAAMDPPIIMGSVATFEGKCTVIFGFAENHLDKAREKELQERFRSGVDEVVRQLEGA